MTLARIASRIAFGLLVVAWNFPSLARAADQTTRFDVNDVSILWPAPKTPTDVGALISADDMLSDGTTMIWPADVFRQVATTAQTVSVISSAGTPFQVGFPNRAAFEQEHTWKIVAIRVDPSAPGTHAGITAEFGSFPQIRLVAQPVTVTSGQVQVHDFTAHLVFNYITGFDSGSVPGAPRRGLPDKVAFRKVLEDLKGLKALAEGGGTPTKGELSVHPALRARVPGFSERAKTLLKTHLRAERLFAVSFMGLSEPEPWIFFSMSSAGPGKPFKPPKPGQMLLFRGGDRVSPPPRNSQFETVGLSTSLLFVSDASTRLDRTLFPTDARPDIQAIKLSDVADIVANPQRSHFFNTDCVSCHSESTRRSILRLPAASTNLAYQRPEGISAVAAAVLPGDRWNVRNLGWFPDFATGTSLETVSQRTANEAAESADFINHEYFGQPVGATTPANPSPAPTSTLSAVEAGSANPLTLVMDIKSTEDLAALKDLLGRIQGQPPSQNPIRAALDSLGIVHFARFFFIGQEKLAVVTSYDGAFDRYIGAFTTAIGPIFDKLLIHMKDAPPLPVSEHRREFLEYVQRHDLKCIEPFYSAYPELSTQDILTLRRRAQQ